MASPAPAKFRIDVDIHNLLMNSDSLRSAVIREFSPLQTRLTVTLLCDV